MRKTFEDYLMNTYDFYTGHYGRGLPFEHGDGWFQLLKDLSEEINEALKKVDGKMHVYQVKEKFGTLRFYGDFPTDEIDEIVYKYEKMSYNICELCGEPSILRYGGWILNRCDKCFKERK